ncbi:MAG: MarR family transcriptional regulator [Erysipelotrichaceae bacterium]|uniref:MarR family winged helix-turn-helix transcriptional regulator n=1 Tax=Anaerorhabdus sp. TaxID=1872524 RepID=UPI002FC75D06
MKLKNSINKQASIIYRNSHIFFDHELAPYQIGSGQQFFLLRIFEFPGISALEIAKMGHYDKGTCARAIAKLCELGYVTRVVCDEDKRSSQLFVSEQGIFVVKQTQLVLKKWNDILCQDLSLEEQKQMEEQLTNMANRAFSYINKRKQENHAEK